MTLFLKNLPKSFFKSVVSSRPIYNKANSLFSSIAANANRSSTGRYPVTTVGNLHARAICFGNGKRKFGLKSNSYTGLRYTSRKVKQAKQSTSDEVRRGQKLTLKWPNQLKSERKGDGLNQLENVDVEALTGTWVSKTNHEREFPSSSLSEDTARVVKAEDDGSIKVTKILQPGDLLTRIRSRANMSTKNSNSDGNCKEKGDDRVSVKVTVTVAEKCEPKVKVENCKCDKKDHSQGGGQKEAKSCEDGREKQMVNAKNTKLTVTPRSECIQECLAKENKDDKGKDKSKKKKDAVGGGKCLSSPKLDGKLPKVKKPDKSVVGGSKEFIKNICDGMLTKEKGEEKKAKKKDSDDKCEKPKKAKKKHSGDECEQKDGKQKTKKKGKKSVIPCEKEDAGRPRITKMKKSSCEAQKKAEKSECAEKKDSATISADPNKCKKIPMAPCPKIGTKSGDECDGSSGKKKSEDKCAKPKPSKKECKKDEKKKSKERKMICTDDKDRDPNKKKARSDTCLKKEGSKKKLQDPCKEKKRPKSEQVTKKCDTEKVKKSESKTSKKSAKSDCLKVCREKPKPKKDEDQCKKKSKTDLKKSKTDAKKCPSNEKKSQKRSKTDVKKCGSSEKKAKKESKTDVKRCGSSEKKPQKGSKTSMKKDSCQKTCKSKKKEDKAQKKSASEDCIDLSKEDLMKIVEKCAKKRKAGDCKEKATGPPDQSPIMQCIALCKKKKKANKPQVGKGVPPRDKKPVTEDKKVFQKLVEFDECRSEKKEFVPCMHEKIKPGIRDETGEAGKKESAECGEEFKKKKKKMPKCQTKKKGKKKKGKKEKVSCEKKEETTKEANFGGRTCPKIPNPCAKKEEASEVICECPDKDKDNEKCDGNEKEKKIRECPDQDKDGEKCDGKENEKVICECPDKDKDSEKCNEKKKEKGKRKCSDEDKDNEKCDGEEKESKNGPCNTLEDACSNKKKNECD